MDGREYRLPGPLYGDDLVFYCESEESLKVVMVGQFVEVCEEKRKENRSKEKVVGFSSASLFPARKREALTQGGTRGIDHLTQRRNQEAGVVKGWEDKRDSGSIQDTFT